MTKVDFKRLLKPLYAPTAAKFVEVDVPPMSFVKVDGFGNPNTVASYAQAVQSLYGVSFAMKFAAKNTLDRDYVVPPLEGLWWADDPSAFVSRRKDEWRWTMMIMVPEFVTREMFDAAVAKTRDKIGALPDSLRLEDYAEGPSLQILHVGSYDEEGPTLDMLHHDIMPERNLAFNGPHHEIYLSDPRKTVAAKLRTVLRQPVRPMGDGLVTQAPAPIHIT